MTPAGSRDISNRLRVSPAA